METLQAMDTLDDENDAIPVEEFLVAYAKIVESDDGIMLQGVYFGGIGPTYSEAEKIARDCVNSIRGGTIMPKVLKLHRREQVIDALFDATDSFEEITARMVEADETIKRAHNRRR